MLGIAQDICARHSALSFYMPHTPFIPRFFMRFSHTCSGSALDSWNLTPAPSSTTVCMVAFRSKLFAAQTKESMAENLKIHEINHFLATPPPPKKKTKNKKPLPHTHTHPIDALSLTRTPPPHTHTKSHFNPPALTLCFPFPYLS